MPVNMGTIDQYVRIVVGLALVASINRSPCLSIPTGLLIELHQTEPSSNELG